MFVQIAIAVLSLAALAVVHGWLLDRAMVVDRTMNLGLLFANLFFVGNYFLRYRNEPASTRVGYFAGYAGLFLLILPLLRVLPENLLLGIMLLMLYSGLFAKPFFVGYLFLFVLCYVFVSAYALPAFVLAGLLYTGCLPLARIWREEENRLLPTFFISGGVLLFCLLLPLVYFCVQSSPQTLIKTFQMPEVRKALWLSFWTASSSTLLVCVLGVPLAYVLARTEFPGKAAVNALVDLPLLIPPPVAGVALLALLGPNTPLGRQLERLIGEGFSIVSSHWGIMSVQVFVGSPFVIRSAMIAFHGIDAHYERVARTLGASASGAFFRVTLPLALPGVFVGMILMWFRALGEFAATWFVAATPETAPILVWKKFHEVGSTESQPIAVLLVILFLSLFAGLSFLRTLGERNRPVEA